MRHEVGRWPQRTITNIETITLDPITMTREPVAMINGLIAIVEAGIAVAVGVGLAWDAKQVGLVTASAVAVGNSCKTQGIE
jgi:hypothetical protein